MPADTTERTYGITQMRAITASGNDVAKLPAYPRAIYVGVSGDVTLVSVDDDAAVTLTGLAAGMWHPVSFKKLTGATATGIVAGY